MKTCAILTFGCKVNQYESQALREQFQRRGYEIVGVDDAPHVVVLNTCTVTETATAEAARWARRVHRRNPSARIAVTGCAADSHQAEFEGMPGVRRVVLHDEKSALPLLIEDPRLTPAELKPSIFDMTVSGFEGHTRAFLKIQDGCDLNCSFCIIPQVRGRNVSRPLEEALGETRRLAEAGYKELVLTGVHVGSFGKEAAGRSLIPDLVQRMLELPGVSRVRLSSVEANEIDDRLIDVMRDSGGRFCPHLHVPLQSGDDGVLRAMRRRYNTAQFRRTVDRLRAEIDRPGVTTDIIVGFPTETEQAFARTLALCREIGFSRIHVFPYSHRRGTAASALADLSFQVKKERLHAVQELAEDLSRRFARSFIGDEVDVLVEETDVAPTGYTERYVKARLTAGDRNELIRTRGIGVHDGVLQCA
ncbi:MAG: tRNA (N(6)-L-threonylcarbamoyladenosine(37)-C(2))-methylthiotransferase MtaB [Planctomycetes bacterium]|nr:tRNA (N(6)-L-threonylcarbamoyladenosine(37)-C(2))-methylthiotransferase MtaB [Planctomycetota bacterium]